MQLTSNRLSIAAYACALFIVLTTTASRASSQASQTAGVIRGRVTAARDSTALMAATITARNEETGFSRTAITGVDGIYVLRLLPPGLYKVSVKRIGNTAEDKDSVRVLAGSSSSANFAMREAAIALSAVQITADATRIDVTQGGVRQNVSTEEIQNLPTLGRDFTDFINLSGLVSPTPETTTGGQFSIAGARPSQTNVQLDGVDANNSFFGENRGGSRIPFNFSMESIKEFQIITNGFDVEYGNYAGGVINIVSKGGTNRRRASVYGNYRGEAVTSKNFDGTRPSNFEVQQAAMQFEGPIIRDKLFYFVSADGQRRREPFVPVSPATLRRAATQNALRAAGLPAADTQAVRLNGLARSDSATADSLTRFFDILETKYGIDNAGRGYDEFAVSNDVITLFARTDWNINERHRLSVRNNYSAHNNLNETFAAVSTGGVSKAENFKNFTNSLVGELTSAMPKAANVLRVQYSSEHRPRVGNNLLPELRVTNVANGRAFAFGGASISFNNDLDEDKIQIVDNLTFELGQTHSIKLGTNNLFSAFKNSFWNQGSGFYTFDNLAALEAQRPSRYTRSIQADGNAPFAEFSTQDYSLYAQDDWRVRPNMLATLGVRYDVSRYGKRPGRVIDAERAFGIETGIAPVDNNNVSPRASIVYDVKGDASQVVRAGAGLFYGRLPAVFGSNVAITEIPFLSLDCSGSAADNDPKAPPPVTDYSSWALDASNNPMNCAGNTGVGGTPTYAFWTSGFEIPETFRANVGYERLLARDTRVSLDYIGTSSTKLYTVRNINLRPSQFALASEGGRRVFVPEVLFSLSTAATSDRLLNTNFSDVFVNYTDGQARSHAVSLNVDQRLGRETSLKASYTYTTASDNSSFSCCTSFEGFSNTRVGAFGPNVIGAPGDEGAAWGPSAFVRNHTIVVSGYGSLPFGVRLSGVWRWQSGTPWGPEQGGDLNGDGLSFNDRPFIFAAADLPVAAPANVTADSAAAFVASQRDLYASYLNDNKCISKYVGQIIPRNTCRQPSFNRLDLSLRRKFGVRNGQSAEISVDLFNVLNGIKSTWGRYQAVQTNNRNIVTPSSYDASGNKILYTVPTGFGTERTLGTNLLLQFSAQLGIRYSF